MRAVVVYESMYGNTRVIAQAIGEGLRDRVENVVVVPVGRANTGLLSDVDLLVVGGPTHAFGMSRPTTRQSAADAAESSALLRLEPDAVGNGLREWMASLAQTGGRAAAFDTRVPMPSLLGHASRGISRRLEGLGFELVEKPNSFFVTKENVLHPDEETRARRWGKHLSHELVPDPDRLHMAT